MSKEYLKRDNEKKQLKAEVAKANEAKFKNSFIGKAVDGMQKFDKAVNKPSPGLKKGKKFKKGKKLKKRKDYDFFGGDPF